MLDVIELSRLQFALTALYHFFFVPLTLGITFVLAIMETLYVKTGKEVYKDMTKFWGKLFLINFAIGVMTGITMEFQFGTNWSYYSHYVGDIFGAPLAVEGLVAFFLESTFVGIFLFGWDRLSKKQHLLSTYCVAFGSNFSALWILVANGWMQDPVAATFNVEKMRMELSSFGDLVFSEFAQAKFLHTVSAGYTTGSIFVLVISSIYLLKNRDIGFALRSFAVSAVFGLCAISSTIFAGDESGFLVGKAQPSKLAAIEGMYETSPAPAPWTLFAIPNDAEAKNDFAIEVPAVGGLIITRSLTQEVPGINQIREENVDKVRKGAQALVALQALKNGTPTEADKIAFAEQHSKYLGFGLLLSQFVPGSLEDPSLLLQATDEQVKQAADSTVPKVGSLFFSFRIMMACGFALFLLFVVACVKVLRQTVKPGNSLFLKLCMLSLPLPWLAVETGWFVAEYGRQPWTVFEVLPTFVSASTLSVWDLVFSLVLICGIYSFFIFVEAYFMVKYATIGPSALHTGKYHFEKVGAK